MQSFKDDFCLVPGSYLLSHSVGRPLKTAEQVFAEQFFTPWQSSGVEPWQAWLKVIDLFCNNLAKLFNGRAEEFCPQVNLSSALTKLVMSLPQFETDKAVILMSELDFPSMGFALKKALPSSCELRFIPKSVDLTDPEVWRSQIESDVDLVFVSHAYSNTGQQAPLSEIVNTAKSKNVLTLIDVAQSAGVVPLDLQALQPDFMIGSSVKWLCGGPGAAYLWVNSQHIEGCQPKDVGWFSHENPFEFDIHNFRYHPTGFKFWGGTPSIAPYVIAAHSIGYFAEIGSHKLREHNQWLIDVVAEQFETELVSPRLETKRSATLILNFAGKQPQVLAALQQANVSVDLRSEGIRVSPHIYNDMADIERLLSVIKGCR
ncbi:aminotransferase class V-fold PLP-dependent enzyme [Shewanella schlegeliana]|uniref:Aminotransferase class V-fold PLP-dependent enzyme n=1 Tax=Shewanella schlegeliana TaxID=190308 RepID=A0ABS1T197_9GAMM|nr:aminotransferase class V-fold PLP-dependent enzyme [Shewanella schlegeliana]MBL4914543.1 aminotransferase class V-fold PLP-dependent enzyme [Shewanella schlegeliana]MCL1109641.1 aminotransferase class V-fold PLP-dependent enzyme [Shewanella schlegeliana]GIU30051.1 class V aminotransferase [Shewanella schlegeliana]